MSMQYSDPRGRLGARSGVMTEGWQYPLSDPAAAVRNKLREMGLLGNPFNQPYQRQVAQMSAGAYPHFLMQMLEGGDPSNSQGVQGQFGDFIGRLTSGEQKPLGYNQALAGMDKLRGNLAGVSQKVSGAMAPGGDMAETLNQMSLSGQLGPMEMALAGMLLNPQDQMDAFHGAMLPSMGPGLVGGLAKAQAPMKQQYDDYLGATLGSDPSTAFTSMLDLLMGKTSGAPGAPSRPMGTQGVRPGGMAPGGSASAPPMQSTGLPSSVAPGGGNAPGSGGTLGGMSQGLTMGGGMDPMQAAMQTGTIPTGMTGALAWPPGYQRPEAAGASQGLDPILQALFKWIGGGG